jgi:8-oxo-dGTP pyrophosphatase MutT (NUDIX family)
MEFGFSVLDDSPRLRALSASARNGCYFALFFGPLLEKDGTGVPFPDSALGRLRRMPVHFQIPKVHGGDRCQPIAAGMILWRMEKNSPLVLVLEASDRPGEWGFPKGHVESGEDLVQAALRECAEETGLTLVEILGPPLPLAYVLPDGRRKVTYYFPACTQQETVVLSPEHHQAKWVPPAQALKLIPFANLRAHAKKILLRCGVLNA